MQNITTTRRSFLCRSVQVAVGLACCSPVTGGTSTRNKRSLSFYHTHTGEALDITYAGDGRYDPAALKRIDKYLRDFRTGEIHPIEPELLDILWTVQHDLGSYGVFEVISGYRSPWTNKHLRKNSDGVARKSLHMEGRAIDVHLTGVKTCDMQKCAIGLKCGGVGYYPKSNFIHLDTGRVRAW
ncbi:MAG: DUF882 domain-containing protein [Desulfobulbaceae bacterium]|nr:DUF882 domain-containing protein [Desulfobulbaceae bacterium]